MENINIPEIKEEAKKVVRYKPKSRKGGGYELSHQCNCYGLTLKYIFALKELTFKKVGNILGVTPQSINHLVNRTAEYNIENEIFLEKLCNQLSINYDYFRMLCEEVRMLIDGRVE